MKVNKQNSFWLAMNIHSKSTDKLAQDSGKKKSRVIGLVGMNEGTWKCSFQKMNWELGDTRYK